jgi:hypothetical protein
VRRNADPTIPSTPLTESRFIHSSVSEIKILKASTPKSRQLAGSRIHGNANFSSLRRLTKTPEACDREAP